MNHYLHLDVKRAHVLVVCFDTRSHGHSGLGMNTFQTVRVLRRMGIRADSLVARDDAPIRVYLMAHPTVTHCLIEAPWLSSASIRALAHDHPGVHFLVRSHSQVGFLQVEAGAIKLIREQLLLQDAIHNFSVAANSEKLATFLSRAYQARCVYLPNLYDLDRASVRGRDHQTHRVMRFGSFGALRILKNHTTAAAAALMVAQARGVDVEFHVNVDREEHGKGVLHALHQIFRDLPYAKLVEVPWAEWAHFRRRVAHMDLCFQTSVTETFNLVTADAAAEGVPSVVGSAIEWVPPHWQADVDSAEDCARVASRLLSDRHAPEEGVAALRRYTTSANATWLAYLGGHPDGVC